MKKLMMEQLPVVSHLHFTSWNILNLYQSGTTNTVKTIFSDYEYRADKTQNILSSKASLDQEASSLKILSQLAKQFRNIIKE